MQNNDMPWVNYDAALQRVRDLGDVGMEQLVMRAVTLVVQRVAAGNVPVQKLDLLYFVEVMIELFQQRDALVRVLEGEDLRWFRDES